MNENRKPVVHISAIVLYVLLAAITMLFIAFSVSYIYLRVTNDIPPVNLPSLFYINTLVLVGSSYLLIRARKCYKSDDTKGYQTSIALTLLVTLIFLVSQIFAWKQMYNNAIFVNYNNLASFMYLISGVHFLHVIIGIPFLVVFVIDAFKKMKSPVTVLLYFSDDSKKRRLDLFNIYWHYLDILWVYLVLFFLVNYLL